MFADYTTLVLSHPNINSPINNTNDGLIAYANWFNAALLSKGDI